MLYLKERIYHSQNASISERVNALCFQHSIYSFHYYNHLSFLMNRLFVRLIINHKTFIIQEINDLFTPLKDIEIRNWGQMQHKTNDYMKERILLIYY